MNFSANVCRICKTKNQLEAIFCENCGVKLDAPFMDSEHISKTTDMQALTPEMVRDWSFKEAKELAVPESGIAFYVDGQSIPAYIDSKGDFVLGRKSGKTSEILLDLAPFGRYALGLSRRHAVIRPTEHGYDMLDLGSVKGTWLNDEKLIPHRPYPLPSGSHLRVGRMLLFVLYRSFSDTN